MFPECYREQEEGMRVSSSIIIRPNKQISVFRVTGLKHLLRVCTHIFLKKNLEKVYNFMHFERRFAFQNALNYIFSRKPE